MAFPISTDKAGKVHASSDDCEGFWKNLKEGDDSFERTGVPLEMALAGCLYQFSQGAE
jgi:murein L,D-transpeptidase YafK